MNDRAGDKIDLVSIYSKILALRLGNMNGDYLIMDIGSKTTDVIAKLILEILSSDVKIFME